MDSIISQTKLPKFIVIVDDGSTDNTAQIIKEKKTIFQNVHVVNSGSKVRDIRKVPRLLNRGIEFSKGANLEGVKYMMVSGDDNELTVNYARDIIDRMENDPKVVVASGGWIHSIARTGDNMPHGAGRFINLSFFEYVGGKFPVAYGWEPWILYKALEFGFKVKLYGDLRYNHLRPYNPKNLFGWGRAMYSLGFPTYFVFLRFLANFLMASRGTQTRKAAITMLVGYLSAKLAPQQLGQLIIKDKRLKTFVNRYTGSRIIRLLFQRSTQRAF